MKMKTIAVLSALMTVILSGCGTGDNKEDASSAVQSKSVDTAVSSEVLEVTESAVETEESTVDIPEEQFTESVEDLALFTDKRDIKIGVDDSEVIFVARDIIDEQKVELIDADTAQVVGVMLDNGEFEKSGDDIMGDAWYSLRYKLDDTFPTDPDVSEDRKYRFYARYIDGTIEHRTNTAEIIVYESFTDKELEKMDSARNKINELQVSEDFKAMDTNGKKEKMLECLRQLEDEGIVDKGSIHASDDSVTYSSCEIPVVVMLEPMPWQVDSRYR
jgi:hypothetical protein